MSEEPQRTHVYHSEAAIVQGNLKLPFAQTIGSHTYSKLNEQGGYVTQHSQDIRLGGALSFKSAHTHVAGNLDEKADHGWNTLATAVIEGLNIMEIVTADRIVAQISTDHPRVGYVPTVTFLGTRFENLRIAGKPITADIDWNMLGQKPAADAAYTKDSGLIDRAKTQRDKLPDAIRSRYNQAQSADSELIECSLVHQVEGSFPGRSYGHVLDIPDFGKVYLAMLSVRTGYEEGVPKTTTISLNMLELKMGCMISGDGTVGGLIINGGTKP